MFFSFFLDNPNFLFSQKQKTMGQNKQKTPLLILLILLISLFLSPTKGKKEEEKEKEKKEEKNCKGGEEECLVAPFVTEGVNSGRTRSSIAQFSSKNFPNSFFVLSVLELANDLQILPLDGGFSCFFFCFYLYFYLYLFVFLFVFICIFFVFFLYFLAVFLFFFPIFFLFFLFGIGHQSSDSPFGWRFFVFCFFVFFVFFLYFFVFLFVFFCILYFLNQMKKNSKQKGPNREFFEWTFGGDNNGRNHWIYYSISFNWK